jgi:arsenite methyltransferase
MQIPLSVETVVRQRYSAASKTVEPALCCSVTYDRKYLEVLPVELIERDYGCGDPSRFVKPEEIVLDLGSGGGKICYIASQIVGPKGRVIGVDMNDDMLALARKHQREIAGRIGWDNVTFHRGRIQDLALSLDQLDELMHAARPVESTQDYLTLHRQIEQTRRNAPLIPSESIDVVLSNCVLNLVDEADREQLFREVFRVLRPGGRAVISDIVSSRPVPAELKADPTLWSGCISGAFEEQEFLRAFSTAGFGPALLVTRQVEPWTVVKGIEFRSVTARAYKADRTVLPEPEVKLDTSCSGQEECC